MLLIMVVVRLGQGTWQRMRMRFLMAMMMSVVRRNRRFHDCIIQHDGVMMTGHGTCEVRHAAMTVVVVMSSWNMPQNRGGGPKD